MPHKELSGLEVSNCEEASGEEGWSLLLRPSLGLALSFPASSACRGSGGHFRFPRPVAESLSKVWRSSQPEALVRCPASRAGGPARPGPAAPLGPTLILGSFWQPVLEGEGRRTHSCDLSPLCLSGNLLFTHRSG